MIEAVTVAADWSVQGMGASYKGTHTFGLNVEREEPPEDIEMRARARARQLVADCGCWPVRAVQVSRLQVIRNRAPVSDV
ncbi:hypothetical protein N5C70_27405 [Pseudomonas juntendi]|uniref:Uncharacterized protein n=1 Tax=Pseudomonas juntendi TaxID=2666183 RepID=A0ABD4YM70_9PSED|nr:hypothetical protein [Pseudomonas juntendi]MDH0760392.1 hypothetical protein [Pseudomonas juntendi]MDH1917847.1 hypothetical protein [Pseudomonas juntendi]